MARIDIREEKGKGYIYKPCKKVSCRGPAPADPGYSKERRLGDLFKC